jgi:hypothetical protein
MKQDPNKQQHHTFGSSAAAERLKQEIDNGANYRSAVRILNKGQAYINVLLSAFVGKEDGRYFLQLLHKDILAKIDQTGSDVIVESLCRNVFTAKYRLMLKLDTFKP